MHVLTFLSGIFALAAPLVSAIQFTEPVANATLKRGETYSVKWTSVDTDPTSFSIFLVNFVDWPPFYTQVASDVPTSAGEHQVTVPCDVNGSWGFQFNAINGTNVYVIYAQTPKFHVRDGSCAGSPPVPPPNGGDCPFKTPETVTTTVTVSIAHPAETQSACKCEASTTTSTITITESRAEQTTSPVPAPPPEPSEQVEPDFCDVEGSDDDSGELDECGVDFE